MSFKLIIAKTFFTRLLGLYFKTSNTIIYFPNCTSIHTFLLKKTINIAWINKNKTIIKIENNIWPNQIRINKQAYWVIEWFNSKSK